MGKLKNLTKSFLAQAVLETSIIILEKLGVNETQVEKLFDEGLYPIDDEYIDIENADLSNFHTSMDIEVSLDDVREYENEGIFTITSEFEELVIQNNGRTNVHAMCVKVIDQNNKQGWLPYYITRKLTPS